MNQALSGNSHLSLRPSPHNRGKNIMGRDRGVRTPLAAATWQAALWPGCGSSRAGPPPGSGVLGSLPLPSAAPGAPVTKSRESGTRGVCEQGQDHTLCEDITHLG
jgi:hypothetical protein